MHHPSSNVFGPLWTPPCISPARQCRPGPGPGHMRARCRLGLERCVCVVLCFLECAGCFRLVQGCPVSACHPGWTPVAAKGVHQQSSNPFCTFWTPLWISPARQCRHGLGPGYMRARCRAGLERCVCVVLCFLECAGCFRLVQVCPESACDPG